MLALDCSSKSYWFTGLRQPSLNSILALNARCALAMLCHAACLPPHPLRLCCSVVGDPFGKVDQGPQIDQEQFNKIMGYIEK